MYVQTNVRGLVCFCARYTAHSFYRFPFAFKASPDVPKECVDKDRIGDLSAVVPPPPPVVSYPWSFL
jgi:hypothetical protein